MLNACVWLLPILFNASIYLFSYSAGQNEVSSPPPPILVLPKLRQFFRRQDIFSMQFKRGGGVNLDKKNTKHDFRRCWQIIFSKQEKNV
jgi:hypothetical protein